MCNSNNFKDDVLFPVCAVLLVYAGSSHSVLCMYALSFAAADQSSGTLFRFIIFLKFQLLVNTLFCLSDLQYFNCENGLPIR